jgi:site-specific DNA-methyltransferase (adenine-specific)
MTEPYYEDGSVTIYHGDCLRVLAEMPFSTVDAIVMDPPYFLPASHYSVRSGTFRSLGDLSMLEHFFRDVFAACARVLKPTGFLYAFCDGQSYPPFYATAFPHFKNIRPLIWDKQTSVNGYAWRHQHELILFATMVEAPNVKTGDGDIIRERAVPIEDRDHLAEKPEAVLTRLIDKTTPPGGVVLDPFMGSGSTLRAARFLGYRAVGVEVEERFCELAARRMGQGVFDFGAAA